MEKTQRISNLVSDLFAKLPEVESARAKLITESYAQTESLPIVARRGKAFQHILEYIPIIIRDGELVVGSSTIAPRGCQTYPEFSYAWLQDEFDTLETRSADPFYISEQTKADLYGVHKYWTGKTTSELALSYMSPQAQLAVKRNMFTVGNYFYNGVGHVSVAYDKILQGGFNGVIAQVRGELDSCHLGDADYASRTVFLEAVLTSCEAAIAYARRYSALARDLAAACPDPVRKQELLRISENCANVPANGAKSFYEACQSFWFVHQLIQLESSGHSISPGRFDQYMYPYYKEDLDRHAITPALAQELIDCVWVKLNDLNKCRDHASAEGFAGYSLFQNLVVGGQDINGRDATNDISYMCLEASHHVFLPQPSLSIRVWNGSPHALLVKAAELTRTGDGLPAYYNDEVIIPSLLSRGLSLEDARDYCLIGCVEPQKAGKTDGWHDAAFFNMCRVLELVFSDGMDGDDLVGIKTGDIEGFTTFEQLFDAYKAQMDYQISLLVNADNSVDMAHATRCPLPFLSSMVDDCIGRGKTVQEGGAVYNFTGPQGFGIANVTDALYAIRKLVFEDKRYTLAQFKRALTMNFGMGLDADTLLDISSEVVNALSADGRQLSEGQIADIVRGVIKYQLSDSEKSLYREIYNAIADIPKYGNDIEDVDLFAREIAYTYTRPVADYKNPRGGSFQAGLYPVSANVPLGAQTGATPDGRLARTPIADGVSPSAGRDVHGPTAAANSVSRLDHGIASNGTLFNMKFHPSALAGENGINNFVALIRSYFDQKGSHMQFNVVDKDTLLAAQSNPGAYRHLIVRVAGYSALFTTLSKSLQDDIIKRTEQGKP